MPAIFCAQCPSAGLVQCESDQAVYCPNHERVCPDCRGSRRAILRTLTSADREELKSRGVLR